MIVIATHAVFLNKIDIYGPPHAVSLFLNRKKIPHIFIKHDLYGKEKSIVEFYDKGKKTRVKKFETSKSTLFRYIREFYINFSVASQQNAISLFIGVDPLNAFCACLLKMAGNTSHSVYFCADFAVKRFDNFIMNAIYHTLDNVCSKLSDQTWSISKRVIDYRKKRGLIDEKNVHLPNAPFFDDIPRIVYSKMDHSSFVVVSALEKGIDFEMLFRAFKTVRHKYPKSSLHIIGTGSLEERLKMLRKELFLSKSIIFHGALSHDEMFKKIVKLGVGIALYADYDKNHFRYFSDPMKVRDYLASGLPVLVSGNTGIIEEIEKEKVGYRVKLQENDLVKKMELFLINSTKLEQFHLRALALAKKYDTNQTLTRYLLPFLTNP